MIEMARSDCRLAASQMPTTFSTALPAIPTMTRPVNALEMPIASTAGSSAATNQSETSAAATPPAASSPIAKRKETCGRAGAGLGGGMLVRAQVRPQPRAVDDEQADGADHRDRELVVAGPVADLV